VKVIPTTSLAKTKEERKNLRRAVLEHGNTDSDAIEDKRQHSARQLIKLGETVNKLTRHRILMEEQGEKKIEEMRKQHADKRAEHAANPKCTPEWLAKFDQQSKDAIELESFQLSALIMDSELRTNGLSAQIMIIDALNLVVDCLSLREREEDDGKKVHVRITTPALLSDILLGVDDMNSKVDAMIEGFAKAESTIEESIQEPLKNKPIPSPNGVKA
jgi:hypothetical protein